MTRATHRRKSHNPPAGLTPESGSFAAMEQATVPTVTPTDQSLGAERGDIMGIARTDSATSASNPQPASSLEQVREILFGQYQREYERKLARVESHLSTEAADLRSETKRRLEFLQAHGSRELDALKDRIDAEKSAQLEAIDKLSRETRETAGTLEQRLARCEDTMARAERDLRQQILVQSQLFLDEIQKLKADLMHTLEREVSLYRKSLEGYSEQTTESDESRERLESPSESH
jgi:hypothetical protein